MANHNSPFDPLMPILTAAQKVGPTVWGPIVQLEFIFSTGVKIPVEIGRVSLVQTAIVALPDDLDPNTVQIKIIRYLHTGAKSPKQMKYHTANHMYDVPGGIDELIGVGWVVKKYGKFKLSPSGEVVAAELGDDEEEDGDVEEDAK